MSIIINGMVGSGGCGFSEIEHTADWALRVWAPDLSGLFVQAARGMYWLLETRLADGPRVQRTLNLEGVDAEALLVVFLSELLYLGESERIGFDTFSLEIHAGRLSATLEGAPITLQKKEIKAVTYHNLAIRDSGGSLQVTIVFDV